MKTTSVLVSAVAIALLVLYCGVHGLIIALVALTLAYFWDKKLKSSGSEIQEEHFESQEEMIEKYGEPDDVVILNAARASEPEATIAVYRQARFLVIGGYKIDRDKITSVTFNNSGTPYTPSEYQVVIATLSKELPYIHMKVGYDLEWATDVTLQINRQLQQMG